MIGRDEAGRIRLEALGLGEVVAGSGEGDLADGAQARLYIRPESISLSTERRSGANVKTGRVLVDVEGTTLRVISPSKGPGDRMLPPDVHVSFEPADCLVLST